MWLLQRRASSLVSFILVDQLRLLLFRYLRLLSPLLNFQVCQVLQGNKTVCHLEHGNILLKWMQFSFLENRSLVPRKFQVVENHCSNISCAKSSISTPFLHSSKFAQRFTLQASLSGVSAKCRTVQTPLSNSKKSCW